MPRKKKTSADEALASIVNANSKETIKREDMLSTGCTVLNLACSGFPDVAIPKGNYIFYVGDSGSGKTFFSLNILAEAMINPAFAEYNLVYNDVENGALMDIGRFWGPLQEQMQVVRTPSIEEFYYDFDSWLDKGPCIYVVDSMDALSSFAEGKKFEENKEAFGKGQAAKGDYGDGKAKVNSRNIRRVLSKMRDNGSILIILSQTRDNIDAGPFQASKTRSGGHALRFYAAFEIWTSLTGKIEKQYKNKKRQLGVKCRLAVKKNRGTGKVRMADVPIYWSAGIDNTGACVDYLISEGTWSRNKAGLVTMTGLGPEYVGYYEAVVKEIEERSAEEGLHDLVAETWNDIESACQVSRRNKYAQAVEAE